MNTRQAPTMLEELLRMVSQEARTQYGWEVVGIDAVTGYRVVIRLHRPNAPSVESLANPLTLEVLTTALHWVDWDRLAEDLIAEAKEAESES